ncbi:carbonic anhydrase-related protein 10-like [Portunus trituberculatus]|uniref:carbonic anhydrase-related protein 10-like n=1 Tax=Portunus trituberculatus TaxID=210409 RepID=UPI001E1D2120|nr:carbonic anhydrase-related protein 10-like [Portunus trituberculatus]
MAASRVFLSCATLVILILATEGTPADAGVGLGWNWEMWWTYDGISGPEFWGVINPAWVMCSEGRRQSPINLDPRTLLHDPNLTPVSLDKTEVQGILVNTGHSLEWRVKPSSGPSVNLSGGPLSYTYTVSHLRLHFGERDLQGSEHTIANHAFPAELQVYGYNAQLYRNFTQAASQVYGVVAIAVLVQLGDRTTPALANMLQGLSSVQFGGSSSPEHELRVSELLPTSEQYLTYDGSLTVPGCYETVTWILPNKPLYISFGQMRNLRMLKQGSSNFRRNAPVANNFRPLQSAHHRTVRTNIDFSPDPQGKKCSVSEPKFQYRANDWLHS